LPTILGLIYQHKQGGGNEAEQASPQPSRR
jgi:hypothetical protein